MTANDWKDMSAEQRKVIAGYWAEFWASNGQTLLAAEEMELCLSEQVASPETRPTMLLMALASKCFE